jgi:hypothetical protein
MTVGSRGATEGRLLTVIAERAGTGDSADVMLSERRGTINADLTIGADVTRAHDLRANGSLCSPGVKLHGAGFIVTPEEARRLGLGRLPGLEDHILHYRNGKDLTARPRGVMVIDLFGLSEDQVRQRFPEVYQWVLERVKPERDQNNEEYRRLNWWLFGRRNTDLRNALAGLPRYIATVETAKHRVFQFLDAAIRPDNMLVNIASADAFHLGVLSSRIHVVWALAAGGRLGVGNDPRYNKTQCFDKFPFPDAPAAIQARIRALAEELDGLRKRQQAAFPDLTLTGMYNVLVKLRAGQVLDESDRAVNDKGLVGTLRLLHEDIDAAVAEAYGWPADLADDEILSRLVALNKSRWRDEVAGRILWLRPDYQLRGGAAPAQKTLEMAIEEPGAIVAERGIWPKTLPEQVRAIRAAIGRGGPSPSVETIARQFKGARRERVGEIVQALALMG